jgi:hypothetical protein
MVLLDLTGTPGWDSGQTGSTVGSGKENGSE